MLIGNIGAWTCFGLSSTVTWSTIAIMSNFIYVWPKTQYFCNLHCPSFYWKKVIQRCSTAFVSNETLPLNPIQAVITFSITALLGEGWQMDAILTSVVVRVHLKSLNSNIKHLYFKLILICATLWWFCTSCSGVSECCDTNLSAFKDIQTHVIWLVKTDARQCHTFW